MSYVYVGNRGITVFNNKITYYEKASFLVLHHPGLEEKRKKIRAKHSFLLHTYHPNQHPENLCPKQTQPKLNLWMHFEFRISNVKLVGQDNNIHQKLNIRVQKELYCAIAYFFWHRTCFVYEKRDSVKCRYTSQNHVQSAKRRI